MPNWMRLIRTPLTVALILYLGFLGLVLWTSPMLPERVASHFGPDGTPNGWMSKGGYLTFSILFGLGLLVVVSGIFSLIPVLPHWMVNLPHKEYWLGPEQRADTRRYIIRQGLWLACLILIMFGATHLQVVHANRSDPARLPSTGLAAVLISFITAVGLWTFFFVRRFYRPGK